MKHSNSSQKSHTFHHNIPQFLLEMGEITQKQQNIGGEGSLGNEERK